MRSFILLYTTIVIISWGCSCKAPLHDYSRLIDEAGDNRAEIRKLVEFYNSQKEGPKKLMTAYLLDRIPFQYQLQVSLINQSGNRTPMTGPIAADSIEVLRNRAGMRLRIDTVWDRHILKADFIIALLNDCDSLRQLELFSNMPLPEFCDYILPYRVNNEEIFPYKSLFGNRYLPYISDVLLKNADTIRTLRGYLDPYFSSLFFPSLNYVDFFSTPSLHSVLQQGKSYPDYEDVITLNIHALRAVGIACTYEYMPVVKKNPKELIRINMLDNKGETRYNIDAVKWPYKFMIAKAYRNTFDVKKAVNPYAELKKNGVPEEDIPFVLNIPKVIDITEQRTITKNLTLPVPAPLNTREYVYIAALQNSKWKIQSWAKVDRATNMATFNNMGVQMIYHLACFHKGRTQLIGTPFVVDSLGHLQELAATNVLPKIELGLAGDATPIKSQSSYAVYYWDPRKHDWAKIAVARTGDGTLSMQHVYPDALYKVVAASNDGLKENTFTLENAKQVWW